MSLKVAVKSSVESAKVKPKTSQSGLFFCIQCLQLFLKVTSFHVSTMYISSFVDRK